MINKFKKISNNFDIGGDLIDVTELDGGNIHGTYVLTFKEDEKYNKYIFQQINTSVFTEPFKLMNMIESITDHMNKNQNNGSQVLHVVKTKNNRNLHVFRGEYNTEYWRVYNHIKNCISYNDMNEVPEEDKLSVARLVGKAYGNFLSLLSDYPVEKLEETIPNFHNTEKRWSDFLEDVEKDVYERVESVSKEIVFLLKRRKQYALLNKLVNENKIPVRPNHNDTKINNVLINLKEGTTSVIDLDTVMPGILSDPADALRSLINEAGEETRNLDEVNINMDILESFIDGYASETHSVFNEEEIKNIGNSLHIITLELGMRFLNDHINGDVYFKTDPNIENHNLIRSQVQLKLADEIEKNKDNIDNIINSTYSKYKALNTPNIKVKSPKNCK